MEIRKLNTIRGLAALIVFITHFSDATNWLDGALGGSAGQYGVMLFFLLSGFLMAFLYFERSFDKENIKAYFVARVVRIFPLYLAVVCSSFLLYQFDLKGLYEIKSTGDLIAHLAFVYGESVLWTISPEVQFYILFLVFWCFAAKRSGYIYVLVIAILLLLFFTNFPRIYGEINDIKYNFFHVLRSLPYFFIGMLLGMNYKAISIPDYLKKNVFIIALVLIPLMFPHFSPVTSDAKTKMWLSYEVLLVMSAVFYCLVYLVPEDNLFLANSIGDFLGKISYSLYLLHVPVIAYVSKFSISVEVKLVASLSASVAIAYLSYRFFEKPAARVIRQFAPRN